MLAPTVWTTIPKTVNQLKSKSIILKTDHLNNMQYIYCVLNIFLHLQTTNIKTQLQ